MRGAAHMVLGMAVPRPDPSKPVPKTLEGILYADAPEEPGAGVRALRIVRDVVASLQERTRDGILAGEPPWRDFIRLWRIDIWLRTGRGMTGAAEIDYFAEPFCPLAQRELMMGFVTALRRSGVKRRRRP